MEEVNKTIDKNENLLVNDNKFIDTPTSDLQNFNQISRRTVTIELNRYGILYTYPGDHLIAKTHSKTFRVGDFQENYERKCQCCEKNIPTRYFTLNHHIKSKELMKYGIDLTNFFTIIKNYYFYIIYFFISYLIQTTICLLIYGVPNIPFNFSHIEIYYQIILYGNLGQIFIDIIFNLIRIALVLIVYLSTMKKLKKNLNDYKKNLYDNYYIDESVYSLFVKNLPKIIDKEDFKNHLSNEYSVQSIKDVIILKDVEKISEYYYKIESLNDAKKRMEVTNSDLKFEVQDFEDVELQIKRNICKLKNLIEFAENEISASGTAVVIFEKNEDKNQFFRKNFYNGIYCCFNCRKPHLYKGKKIYFETIPSLNQIDWKNVSYSLEKILSGNTIRSFLTVLIFLLLSGALFLSNYQFNKLRSFQISGFDILKVPFLKAVMLMILNIFLENVLNMTLSLFHFSDKYFKEVSIRYILMQKTFFNTVIINILLFQRKLNIEFDLQFRSFLYFLLLMAIKSILFTRFSEKYFKQKIKYLFLTKILKRKLIQIDLHELYSDNEFSIFRVFEKYRILVFSSLFLMKLFPISSILLMLCVLIHYHVIKFSLFRSSLKDINYYGYYFTLLMRMELTNFILIIFILGIFSSLTSTDGFEEIIAQFAFFIVSDLNNLLHFRLTMNLFTINKNYSEMEGKFKSRFKDEKFVDLKILKSEFNFS